MDGESEKQMDELPTAAARAPDTKGVLNGVHHVPLETTLGKVQHTLVGLAASMVIPFPGAIETFLVANAIMWMSDDLRFILIKSEGVDFLV